MNLNTKATEDVSYMLETNIKCDYVKKINDIFVREPDNKTNWLIDVVFNGFTMPNREVLNILRGYIKYGHIQEYDIWTAVGTGDRKEYYYDKICICVDIFDNVSMEPCVCKKELEKNLKNITAVFDNKENVEIIPRESIESALSKASELSKFVEEEENFNHILELTLEFDDPNCISGKDILDVMSCLGIEWGDMDIFHAINTCIKGDDYLFSIHTNNEPGFFWIPTIETDRFKDLVFTMNIARTYKPEEVFNVMYRCIEYIKLRLGGTIFDDNGQLANKEEYIKIINDTNKRFEKVGCEPGEDVSVFLF